MNTDRHSQAEQKDLIVDPIERARQEAQNGVLQFEMVLDVIQSHITPNHKPFKLKPSAILRLQEAALRGIHPLAGTFRNTAVSISGSKHAPPESFMVADEISDLCDYVNENWDSFDASVVEYMNHTLAAARALDLTFLDDWSVPSHKRSGLFNDYKDFVAAVDNFKVQVQISNARGTLRYSVKLQPDEKDKLRLHVSEIKKVIDGASLAQWKKERLYDLINAFLSEVDRDRAPWDRFADLVVGLAHLGGEAAKELKPARELIDSIARILGRSKEIEESAPKLPAPPKRISPPKELPPPDDEIPF